MTRHELNRIMADKFAGKALPLGISDADKILRAQQIADDFADLRLRGLDHGAAFATALMRGGYLSGQLGGPFDGAKGT